MGDYYYGGSANSKYKKCLFAAGNLHFYYPSPQVRIKADREIFSEWGEFPRIGGAGPLT